MRESSKADSYPSNSTLEALLEQIFLVGGVPSALAGNPCLLLSLKGPGSILLLSSPFAACKADLRLTTPHVDELPRIARPRHTVGARALPFKDRVAFEPLPSSSPFVRAT